VQLDKRRNRRTISAGSHLFFDDVGDVGVIGDIGSSRIGVASSSIIESFS